MHVVTWIIEHFSRALIEIFTNSLLCINCINKQRILALIVDFRKLETNKQTKVQDLNDEGNNGEVNNNLQ